MSYRNFPILIHHEVIQFSACQCMRDDILQVLWAKRVFKFEVR